MSGQIFKDCYDMIEGKYFDWNLELGSRGGKGESRQSVTFEMSNWSDLHLNLMCGNVHQNMHLM